MRCSALPLLGVFLLGLAVPRPAEAFLPRLRLKPRLRLAKRAIRRVRTRVSTSSRGSRARTQGSARTPELPNRPRVQGGGGDLPTTVRRGGEVSQTQLSRAWGDASSRAPSQGFQKADAVVGYRIPDDAQGLADLPQGVRRVLGEVDQATYTDAYIRQNRGNHIMMQFKKSGDPDFFLSEGSRSAYQVLRTAPENTAPAMARLPEFDVEPGQVQVLRKRQVTEMQRARDLGVDPSQELVIQAPWGGTQTKPAGGSAWIVRNGDEFYMVQADAATGLPLGYIRPSRWTRVQRGARRLLQRFTGAETSLLGM